MKDALGQDLYICEVDQTNKLVLPTPIHDHLKGYQETISGLYENVDLCSVFTSVDTGFLVADELRLRSYLHNNKIGIGSHPYDKDYGATNHLSLLSANFNPLVTSHISVPINQVRTYRPHLADAINDTQYVVRKYSHAVRDVGSMVQVVPKRVWNEQFPDYKV